MIINRVIHNDFHMLVDDESALYFRKVNMNDVQ